MKIIISRPTLHCAGQQRFQEALTTFKGDTCYWVHEKETKLEEHSGAKHFCDFSGYNFILNLDLKMRLKLIQTQSFNLAQIPN